MLLKKDVEKNMTDLEYGCFLYIIFCWFIYIIKFDFWLLDKS